MSKLQRQMLLVLAAAGIAGAQDYPRVETFLGYTYMRANSASDVPSFSANGGSGQVAVNFNKWIGFVGDFGGVHNGNINGNMLDSTFVNFLFGPRLSFRHSRVSPYFNVLFGGMYATTSGAVVATPQSAEPRSAASQTAFAMATGGGLDIKISKHVSFRPIGLDYFMTRLQNFRSAQDNNQHNIRYTAGFNFTFGGEAPTPPSPPPAPPMRTCWNGSSVPAGAECPNRDMDLHLSASQTELCPGSIATISPAGTVPQGAVYQWAVEGQSISQAAALEFGSVGRTPGVYKVGLTVNAPGYNEASAASSITVLDKGALSGTLEVSPSEIWSGEKATLSLRLNRGQCGGNPGSPTFTAAEGSISGNVFDSSEVQFDPSSNAQQRKSVTIIARVGDEKGSATMQAAVVVKKPAAGSARRLPDIVFPSASARVNNCGKRVLLEELRAILERDPSGKVVLVGHVSEKEGAKTGLDQQRALNAAAVISAGQGICYGFAASRILVGAAGSGDNGIDFQSHFCGTTQELPGSTVKESETEARLRRVEVWFVPAGGALPASVTAYTPAAALAVSNLGCPR